MAYLLRTLVFCALLSLCWSKTLENQTHHGPNDFDHVDAHLGDDFDNDTHGVHGTQDTHGGHGADATHGELSGDGHGTPGGADGHGAAHGDGHGNGTHEQHRFVIFAVDFPWVQSPIIIVLWLFCACLGKIAFHMTPKLSHLVPESCMLIMMGLVIGGIFIAVNPDTESQVSVLQADVFFLYMLPPIILDAGYFMPNRLFFDQLGTILMLAVIGTIWNALTIGISLYALALTGLFGEIEKFKMLHVLLFSSLISAVDPVAVLAVFEEIHVEEILFIIVFGESLLNDGVTVVLYHMFEGFSHIGEENIIAMDIIGGIISFLLVALGGTFIGIVWGFLTAFVTRFTHQVSVIEPIFIFLMSYLSYLNAELFHWSGILAITFCGITMKNYTEQNMSENSQTTTKYAMKVMASSSETLIFLFLGVATVHGTTHEINGWFIFFTIFFCSVYRAIGTVILIAICNRFRVIKIDFVQKFIMSYGGLRGAIAFALAITINRESIPAAPIFATATISMVFFTVFVQGMTIKPLVAKLGVKKSEKRNVNMNERLHERTMDYVMAGVEDITGKLGNFYIRNWFKRINAKYIVPCLVRHVKIKEPKLFETLSHLKMQDALSYMHHKPTTITDLESISKVLQSNLYAKNSIREWNLDVHELEYKPGDRDINEARFHHILSNEYHPIKTRRQSTYKRHAVRDDELQTQTDFHNQMYQRARQVAMTSIRNRKFKRQLENEADRPFAQQQNGTAVRLKTDYLEDSGRDNKGFMDTENIFSSKPGGHVSKADLGARRISKKGPALAETILPWKRFSDDDLPTMSSKIKRSISINGSEDGDMNEPPPTMAEIQLPWKRTEDDDVIDTAVKQNEFPPWATNKNYIDYYSPSNTVLGKIVGFPEKKPTIKEIFTKRNSSSNLFGILGRRGSGITDEMPSLRNSAKDDIYARRSSLKHDPTAIRRESVKDFKELNAYRAHLQAQEIAKQQQQQQESQHPDRPDRRSSRDSIGHDSLLNTVIVEEEQPKESKPGAQGQKMPKVPSRDYVITMNPGGGTDDTQF